MNEICLQECLQRIEAKLGWGSSQDWLNQDFQLLSDRIFEETRVRLSITTLKRVWGKVNYNSAPSISTLNTLALFLEFDNWSAFRQEYTPASPIIEPRRPESRRFIQYKKPLAALCVLILVISSVMLFISGGEKLPETYSAADKARVSFSSHAVTLGLPNSVVFQYDFAGLSPDSCFIQQSWNEKLTFEIDKNGREASGIYYYPGYFRAKLIANDQILKEHDIHVRTDGWMATIGTQDIPRYLYQEDIHTTDVLRLSPSLYEEVHSIEAEEAPLLTYHFFEDFGQVSGDNFEFETRFRNTYKKSNGICQRTQILIHGKDGPLIVPFSIPGCISDLELFMAGHTISGKTNDLSAFGTDLNEWQHLKCTVKGKEVKIYLNGKLVRSFTSPNATGDIVGFKFRFDGAGEIDYVRLSNDKQMVLNEDFGQ